MKFKQQEDMSKDNSFLKSVVDLLTVIEQFIYAIESVSKCDCWETGNYKTSLRVNEQELKKLAISLNPEHILPTLVITLEPVKSIADLKTFEEKYYNMLKEIGKNALEQNEIEVVSYITEIVRGFKHYFCTLDESNDSGKISS